MDKQKEKKELDCASWEGLPPSVLLEILAKLPTKSVFRFLACSKRLNSLPLQSAFADLHSSLAPPTPMLITHISPTHFIRCVDENDTHHVFQWDFLDLSSVFRRLKLKPRASASGFLCFSLGEEYSTTFNVYYVCNPITREWRTFRLPSGMVDPAIVGMYVDAQTSSCKVIVGADRSRKAFVYDGWQNSWKEIPPLPNHYIKATPAVSIGGRLYWLVEEPNVWGEGQRWVLGFDTLKEIWTEPISILKEFVTVCLGECKGRVVLVTFMADSPPFQVWKLESQDRRARWEHMENGKSLLYGTRQPTSQPALPYVTLGSCHRFPDKWHCYPFVFEPSFRRLGGGVDFNGLVQNADHRRQREGRH